jgi:hypothetical protein
VNVITVLVVVKTGGFVVVPIVDTLVDVVVKVIPVFVVVNKGGLVVVNNGGRDDVLMVPPLEAALVVPIADAVVPPEVVPAVAALEVVPIGPD